MLSVANEYGWCCPWFLCALFAFYFDINHINICHVASLQINNAFFFIWNSMYWSKLKLACSYKTENKVSKKIWELVSLSEHMHDPHLVNIYQIFNPLNLHGYWPRHFLWPFNYFLKRKWIYFQFNWSKIMINAVL